jgi:glutaredoxin-dependent peroxiredoxin
MLNTGTKAPNFSLLNPKRETVTLESMRGKKVVVAFFPAAFTGVCTKEMCNFRDSLAQFNGMNAEVVAVSVDNPFTNGAFAEKNNLNFPVLSDYNRETVNAYDVALPDFAGMKGYTASKRAVFVVDGEGVIRYAWEGPNPGVEPDYAAVKDAVEKI